MLAQLVNSPKAIRTATLAVALLVVSGSAFAQIALVHATTCGPQTFPSATCSIPATGSGNLIVVGWESANGGGSTVITSITDDAGNSYLEASGARSADSAGNTMGDIWYAANSKAGATTLTVTANPNGIGTAVIWQFSGVNTSAPLDVVRVLNSQSASSSPVGAAVTTTVSGDAIVSIGVLQSSDTGIASGNPFTNDSTVSGDGWAHLVTSSTGTYQSQWTALGSGTYCASTAAFKPASVGGGSSSACDLNHDGVVNVLDVQLAIDMDLGLITCTADIEGTGVCNSDVVNRVTTAALGGSCVVTTPSHSATLRWTASVTSNVVGYNIYRATTSGGPYTKMNSSLITLTSYTDGTVTGGETYYYVATAVDSSNNESGNSNQVQAIIPTT